MEMYRIEVRDPAYPDSLVRFLASDAPGVITAMGNLENLKQDNKVAIFASVSCPVELQLKAEKLFQDSFNADGTFIGGFHSPVERRCLNFLLSGTQPVILCPARSLMKFRVQSAYKNSLQNGRMLILSFFKSHRHRSDIGMAFRRNRFVAALADQILVVHAAPASKTEQFCRGLLAWGKPLLTLEDERNQNLIRMGARSLPSIKMRSGDHG